MSASSADRTVVTLGTATPGGGFPVYGQAVADTINEVDATLDVQPRNTKGSTENVPLLEAGSLDLALVQGEVVHEALAGVGRAPADLRVLAAMYSTPGMFVVRADSPYRSIEDLKGRPVAFGARGSGLIILARYVLDGLGLDRDRDFQAVLLDAAGDGPAMVMDGRAAALWGGGIGWPGFTAVARGPAGARFLVPDLDGIRRIQRKHPFLNQKTLDESGRNYADLTSERPSCARPCARVDVRPSSRAKDFLRRSGDRWAYRMVIASVACPSASCRSLSAMPRIIAWLANVCRRVWKLTSSSLAASTAFS